MSLIELFSYWHILLYLNFLQIMSEKGMIDLNAIQWKAEIFFQRVVDR